MNRITKNAVSFCAALFVVSTVAACAPTYESMNSGPSFGSEAQSNREQRRNEEALDELMARARAGETDEASVDGPVTIPLRQPDAVEPGSVELSTSSNLRRATVDSFLARGPHAVLGFVLLVPVREGSALLGYRIGEVFDGGEYVLAGGLQSGDIVLTVNGRPIVEPDDFMAVWSDLGTAEVLDIEYERDGIRDQLTWEIINDVASNDL